MDSIVNNPLLSIIIPTYNGGSFLEQNLSELISQYNSLTEKEKVEVLVSDNASEDNTQEIVLKFLISCPSLKYIRRSSNIGDMSNFFESVKASKGEYIFLLGDDDIICPQFIKVILNILANESNIGIIHWNRIDYKMRDGFCSLFNNDMRLPYLRKYDEYAEFVKSHATMDSMSTVLFSREAWDGGEKYVKERYYGYLWYSRILYGAIGHICYYSYYPLIIQRHPAQRKWIKKQPLYTCGLLNIYHDIDTKLPGVYDWIKKHYVMLMSENFYNEMIIVADNNDFYKAYYSEMASHYKKWQKSVFYVVLFILPSLVSKLIIKTIKVYIFLKRRLLR